MSKYQEYLERVQQLSEAPNQVELVGTQTGGLNVQGSVGGQDMQQLLQKFMNALPEDKRNSVNVKNMFIAWLQKNHTDVWAEIEKIGGFDKLLGNKPPADIIVTGTDEKKGIQINPDK